MNIHKSRVTRELVTRAANPNSQRPTCQIVGRFPVQPTAIQSLSTQQSIIQIVDDR